jgi:hypothetical protein
LLNSLFCIFLISIITTSIVLLEISLNNPHTALAQQPETKSSVVGGGDTEDYFDDMELDFTHSLDSSKDLKNNNSEASSASEPRLVNWQRPKLCNGRIGASCVPFWWALN